MKIYVTPKNGSIVRDPLTKMAIPENGMMIVQDSYINRRIKDGDLLIRELENKPSNIKQLKNTNKAKDN